MILVLMFIAVLQSEGMLSMMNGYLSSYGASTSPTGNQTLVSLSGNNALDPYSHTSDPLNYLPVCLSALIAMIVIGYRRLQ